MKKLVFNAISAGMMISVVSYCNLICGDKYVGSVLFAFGLIVICAYKMSLFTGMAGYVEKNNIAQFCTAVGVNCVTAFAFGALASLNPAAKIRGAEVCAAKFSNNLLWIFVSACFCGILIFLGVDFFKKHGKYIGMIFAIPIFVLCGFDHTVANLFYYGASGAYSAADIPAVLVMILGNFAGSNIMRFFMAQARDK